MIIGGAPEKLNRCVLFKACCRQKGWNMAKYFKMIQKIVLPDSNEFPDGYQNGSPAVIIDSEDHIIRTSGVKRLYTNGGGILAFKTANSLYLPIECKGKKIKEYDTTLQIRGDFAVISDGENTYRTSKVHSAAFALNDGAGLIVTDNSVYVQRV